MRFRCRLSVLRCPTTGSRQLITVFAILVALPLFGEQKTPPPPAPPRQIHWPAITEKKLDNGLTVVLVPLPNVPKITAELTFLVGRGTAYREHPGLRTIRESHFRATSLRLRRSRSCCDRQGYPRVAQRIRGIALLTGKRASHPRRRSAARSDVR